MHLQIKKETQLEQNQDPSIHYSVVTQNITSVGRYLMKSSSFSWRIHQIDIKIWKPLSISSKNLNLYVFGMNYLPMEIFHLNILRKCRMHVKIYKIYLNILRQIFSCIHDLSL